MIWMMSLCLGGRDGKVWDGNFNLDILRCELWTIGDHTSSVMPLRWDKAGHCSRMRQFQVWFLKKKKNKGGLKKERKCFSQKRPFLFFTYNQIWYQWTSWGPFALEFFLILTFDFLVHQVGSVLLTVLQIVLQKVYEWVSNFKEYTQDYSSLEDLQRLKTKERVL